MQEGKQYRADHGCGNAGHLRSGRRSGAPCAMKPGLTVTSLPGACACVTALTLVRSCAPAAFCFEAFLPMEKKERQEILERAARQRRARLSCMRRRTGLCERWESCWRPLANRRHHHLPGTDEKARDGLSDDLIRCGRLLHGKPAEGRMRHCDGRQESCGAAKGSTDALGGAFCIGTRGTLH